MQKSILTNKTILILAPHPDDEAICSGGLIMRAKHEAAKVFVLFGSVGFSRQFLTNETNARERLKELKKASRYGNYSYDIIFQGDEFMRLDTVAQKILIERIEDATQKNKPDIVVIPNRNSFDQDHRAFADACITAFRPLPPALRHQPKTVLECEEPYTWGGSEAFIPNFFVDISQYFEEKIRLLKYHATQLREDPFPRSPNNLLRLAGMRGCEIGTQYAEGYKMLRGQFL